jgi:hypothetical protein
LDYYRLRVPPPCRRPIAFPCGRERLAARPLLRHQRGTSAIFDRYNIVSEDDLPAAAEHIAAYVAQRREAAPRVVALASIRGECAQFAHSDAAGEAASDTGKAVSA